MSYDSMIDNFQDVFLRARWVHYDLTYTGTRCGRQS